jgi:hypothetical protein
MEKLDGSDRQFDPVHRRVGKIQMSKTHHISETSARNMLNCSHRQI